MDSKESKLSIVTTADGTQSTVDIKGSVKEQLFNLTLLTRDVAKTLGVPPFILAHTLPGLIYEYEHTGLASEAMVDIGAIRKGGGTQ